MAIERDYSLWGGYTDVCADWRCNLFWRNRLGEKADTYQQWRQVWRRLVQNGRLERLNPRAQYSEVSETVERVAHHWSKGTSERRALKFRSRVRLNGDGIIGMNDQFILTKTSQNILRTFSRRDLTPGKAITMNGRISCARIFQNFIVCSVNDRISVFDVQDSSKICELQVPQGGSVKQLHLDSQNCLIAFSQIGEKKQCLVWQMTGYSEFSLKYKQQFSGVKQVDVDDENIALVVTDFDQPMILQALLIPTETFVFKSGIPLSCNTPFRYLSGLFFTICQDHLRIQRIDDSRLCGRINHSMSNVHLPNGKIPVAVNSDWLVVLVGDTNNRRFAVYSLDVIKRSRKAVFNPVTELEVPKLEIYDFFVDETQIVFFEKCTKEIHVIDFLDCTSVVKC